MGLTWYFFFFSSEFDFVFIYFFYHIVKKIILLNLRKFMDMFAGLAGLSFFFNSSFNIELIKN
jgi:hypothetical protein